MAAITAVLARFPEVVITAVTHPVTGLPSTKGWLPTVKEVLDACAVAVRPIAENEARLKRIKEQLEMREREAAGIKPTRQQLQEKYGDNWGLDRDKKQKTPDENIDASKAAFEREQSRVKFEYEQIGMVPPSKFALSPSALRDIAERDATRAEIMGRNNSDAA